jgi:hypothetical protein
MPIVIPQILLRLKYRVSCLNSVVSLNFVEFSLWAKNVQKIWRNQAESVSLSVLKASIFSTRALFKLKQATILRNKILNCNQSEDSERFKWLIRAWLVKLKCYAMTLFSSSHLNFKLLYHFQDKTSENF